jgi:histidinol-phosphate/aromatic aminotransferase/cobyric acid decarboxylase-like protein
VFSADVLDAWFPPAPAVMEALSAHLPWLVQTSPPTHAQGLVRAISTARGVPPESLLVGSGSSSLMYLAFGAWAKPGSRVLLPDPTYGEYSHLLEQVLGCRVTPFPLARSARYDLDLDAFGLALQDGYDLVILVNPNSPTGRHTPRAALERALRSAPPETRFWIDETYIDYVGAEQSLEPFAASSHNAVVCKSMSKVYGLSGLRLAYLCAPPGMLDALRAMTPPWSASLPGQVAGTLALRDPAYYARRYAETREMRERVYQELAVLPGFDPVPGVANFLLCHLAPPAPDAATLVSACRTKGVYLRDVSDISAQFGGQAVRIAVRGEEENRRVMAALLESFDS